MTTKTIRLSMFATLAEIKKAERAKAKLENTGYTLIRETLTTLVYSQP